MKKLPKAIMRTPDDVRVAAGGAKDEQEAPAHSIDSNEPADDGAVPPVSGRVDDVHAVAPPVSSPLVTGALAPVAPTRAEFDAGERLFHARAIVDRHATYAAVGGIIPLPIVNVAGVTTVIVRMVKMLSDLYGVPFERDRARAIVIGLVGGTMPTGLAAVTTSTLFYIVPATTLIGLAVSSVTAVACTRSIGRIFVEHFESGATLDDFSAVEGS
jgi:uncharacterized protein (DUF697 family)